MITTNFFRPRNWFFVWPEIALNDGTTAPAFYAGSYLNDQPSEQLDTTSNTGFPSPQYSSEFMIPDPFCFRAGDGTLSGSIPITSNNSVTQNQMCSLPNTLDTGSAPFFNHVLGLTQLSSWQNGYTNSNDQADGYFLKIGDIQVPLNPSIAFNSLSETLPVCSTAAAP